MRNHLSRMAYRISEKPVLNDKAVAHQSEVDCNHAVPLYYMTQPNTFGDGLDSFFLVDMCAPLLPEWRIESWMTAVA